uniref:Uncharacterized protein n=1 Tax=Ditylenchus dipsaci TaxID=166011 RepID=A0A915DFM4_9BILA
MEPLFSFQFVFKQNAKNPETKERHATVNFATLNKAGENMTSQSHVLEQGKYAKSSELAMSRHLDRREASKAVLAGPHSVDGRLIDVMLNKQSSEYKAKLQEEQLLASNDQSS